MTALAKTVAARMSVAAARSEAAGPVDLLGGRPSPAEVTDAPRPSLASPADRGRPGLAATSPPPPGRHLDHEVGPASDHAVDPPIGRPSSPGAEG